MWASTSPVKTLSNETERFIPAFLLDSAHHRCGSEVVNICFEALRRREDGDVFVHYNHLITLVLQQV